MCSCDSDPPTCQSVRRRTARKAHDCYECEHVIQPGERYEVQSIVWEGSADSFKWCADCATLAACCWTIAAKDAAAWREKFRAVAPGTFRMNVARVEEPDGFCFTFGSLRECAAEFLRGFGEERAA